MTKIIRTFYVLLFVLLSSFLSSNIEFFLNGRYIDYNQFFIKNNLILIELVELHRVVFLKIPIESHYLEKITKTTYQFLDFANNLTVDLCQLNKNRSSFTYFQETYIVFILKGLIKVKSFEHLPDNFFITVSQNIHFLSNTSYVKLFFSTKDFTTFFSNDLVGIHQQYQLVDCHNKLNYIRLNYINSMIKSDFNSLSTNIHNDEIISKDNVSTNYTVIKEDVKIFESDQIKPHANDLISMIETEVDGIKIDYSSIIQSEPFNFNPNPS